MTECNDLFRAMEIINEYVSKNAAYHYTLRLEFTRLYENETEVAGTLEDPDGEYVHVDAEDSWIESACSMSRYDAESTAHDNGVTEW